MAIPIITAAVITLLVLGVGGATSVPGSWYWNLRKPAWNPPDWIFGPAWTLILALAAWAGVLAWMHADAAGHARIAALYVVNIALHMLWSPLFFNLRRPDWALIEVPFLWLSVLALMIGLAPYASLAPWLLLPYLLWVGFAAVLNLAIVRLNAPFGAAGPRHSSPFPHGEEPRSGVSNQEAPEGESGGPPRGSRRPSASSP